MGSSNFKHSDGKLVQYVQEQASDHMTVFQENLRIVPQLLEFNPFASRDNQHALICYTNPALGTGTWLGRFPTLSNILNYTGKRPQPMWEKEVTVPDTRKSSYGTVTEEVRHGRNCSTRAFYVDLHRGVHKIFMEEFPMSIPEERSYKHQYRGSSRCQCKDFLRRIPTESQQDLHTRTCKKNREQDLHARTPKRI